MPAAASRRAGPADGLEAVLHGALGVGQGDDVAVVVAYDGQLTHLGECHQPPVGRVRTPDALVEEHVLGGVDAGDVELAQPPQVESPADHRVHPADQRVLGDAVFRGPEREVLHRSVATPADRDRHPAYVQGEGERADDSAELRTGVLDRLRCRRPVQVEVDNRLVPGTTGRDLRGQRRGQLAGAVAQLGHRADRRDQMGGPVVKPVVRDDEGSSGIVGAAQLVQVELSVVALDEHLEHRLLLRDAALQPLREVGDDLLRDGCQRPDPLGMVRHVGIGRERRHFVADAGHDARPLLVHERLVEPTEPHATGQVADDREPQLGRPDQPLQELANRSGERRRAAAAPRSSAGAA